MIIFRMLVGTYLKQLLLTFGVIVLLVVSSFYFLGWWGGVTSIIGVPLILFLSIGYLINEIKKNPMIMLQSMVINATGMSSMLDQKKKESVFRFSNTKGQKSNNLVDVVDVLDTD